jgi:hypothetical protein
MKAWPIDARMNSPKNNEPEIILPTELHPELNLILICAQRNCCYGRMRRNSRRMPVAPGRLGSGSESRIVIEKRVLVWLSVLGLNSQSSAYE